MAIDTITALNSNGLVTLYTKAADNKTKTVLFGPVKAYIGPPMGPQGIADWTALGIDISGSSSPTDSILFNVPASQSATLELNSERNIVLVVTGSNAQKNGTYTLLGRAAITQLSTFINPQFRCYVQKQRTI